MVKDCNGNSIQAIQRNAKILKGFRNQLEIKILQLQTFNLQLLDLSTSFSETILYPELLHLIQFIIRSWLQRQAS